VVSPGVRQCLQVLPFGSFTCWLLVPSASRDFRVRIFHQKAVSGQRLYHKVVVKIRTSIYIHMSILGFAQWLNVT
jgi:hypothetical protein